VRAKVPVKLGSLPCSAADCSLATFEHRTYVVACEWHICNLGGLQREDSKWQAGPSVGCAAQRKHCEVRSRCPAAVDGDPPCLGAARNAEYILATVQTNLGRICYITTNSGGTT